MAPPPHGVVIPLEAAARKLGAWCWAERRCFEILGGWVRDTADPSLKAMLSAHSRHHAWRADRWLEVLPRAYVPPLDELVVAPAEAAAFDLLEGLVSAGNRLEGHYHVLYRALLAAYEASPVVMEPVTDGPSLRAIRIIVGDALHDLDVAEAASQKLSGGISDSDHLTQLRAAVAKTQVSEAKPGNPTSVFQRWGS